MKRKKYRFLPIMLIGLVFYFGYKWDQSRKLDNYFIEEISLDAQVQFVKGDRAHNGPIFEQACIAMKEQGYNPYEIQEIVFKGYKKADQKITNYTKSEK